MGSAGDVRAIQPVAHLREHRRRRRKRRREIQFEREQRLPWDGGWGEKSESPETMRVYVWLRAKDRRRRESLSDGACDERESYSSIADRQTK